MPDEKRKEDALFSNIVFPIDPSEARVPQVRKRFHWFSGVVVGLIFILSLVSQVISANNLYWIETSVHSLFESYCAIIAFIIAYIIYREYASSGKRSNLCLFLGFISMGIFDFFHAYSNHSVTLFVWFHSLSAFSGGVYFLWSALSVKRGVKDPPWLRRLFVVAGISMNLIAAIAISQFVPTLPQVVTLEGLHYMPVDFSTTGEFSPSTITVNVAAAICFLVSGIIFLRYFNSTNDVLFHAFSLSAFLFFESEALFALSRLWDPSWWYWHTIKLVIFVGLVLGLSHGLSRTFNELRESRVKLTDALEKLQHAYSNLKDAQEELIEAEKLASIGKLAATIAHEIRNPLGAITNSVGFFKRHTRLADEDKELMDIVDNEINRLNKIITDFLSFAKPSPMKKTYTNLHDLLEETLALLFADNGKNREEIRITRYFDRELPDVLLDRDAIKQCFWNVLINAVQAMPEGGTLAIKTRYAVNIVDNEPLEEARIEICDSGSGISEEVLARAFQPFFSTKAKGTGLGLSIVQRIIRQHGGDVSLSKGSERGTRVEMTIPVGRERDFMREEKRDGVYLGR